MHRVAALFVALLLTACHANLTAMQRLDLLVTAAAQLCPKGALEKPTQTKLLDCRRADTCLRPVAAAQHAHQDALLAMSRMEDSAGLRLAAEAATAGAIASCRVVGITGGVVKAPVAVAPVVPVAVPASAPAAPASALANPVPAVAPTSAPVTPVVAPVVPASTPAPTSTPAPVPALAAQPAQPAPTAPTLAP